MFLFGPFVLVPYLHFYCLTFRLLKTLDKLVTEGNGAYLNGDEELAYVKYMKYNALIALIKENFNYKRNKVWTSN